MTPDLITDLRPVLDRLQALAAGDPAFHRQLVRALSSVLYALSQDPPAAAAVPVAEPPAAEPAPVEMAVSQCPAAVTEPPPEPPAPATTATVMPVATPPARPTPAPLPALLAFPTTAFLPTPTPLPGRNPYADFDRHGSKDLYVPLPTEDADLPAVEQRCRLKAKASLWAAERARLLRERAGPDGRLDDLYRDLIAEARELPDCFLWMCLPDAPGPGLPAQYETLAHAYESAALAVALLRRLLEGGEVVQPELPRAVELAAEAQSSLRGAVLALDVHKPDRDQLRLFSWLRVLCDEQRILVHRHMRKDDIADARNWADLQQRIRQTDERVSGVLGRGKKRKKLISKIGFVARRLQDHQGDPEANWQTIFRTVDELVQDGVPPSDVDLRDLLLPVLDDLPEQHDDYPKGFRLFLRETDRYLAGRAHRSESETGDEESPTEQVRQARELLAGKAVLLIGGERRPYAAEALERALGLSELVWVETREHQTHAVFESLVARPDVAVVVLAIRWSSHGFGEVKAFCDNYGKPLVRLPAGYNPNSVALHIMDQVGQRLKGVG